MLFGTHNSCTYGSLKGCCTDILLPWTRNQTLTLNEQLEKGVRWFDFRLTYNTKDGIIYLSHTLSTTNDIHTIMKIFADFFNQSPEHPFVIINIRVDYHDRSNSGVINPIMDKIFIEYANLIFTRDEFYESGNPIPLMKFDTQKKLLCYCSDGTIQNQLVFSMELMPTVAFWNAGTIDRCEQIIQELEVEFEKQKDGPFLYPRERMINFDYSSNLPLFYTDYQQLELIKKYREIILNSRPSILAGNHIEDIIVLF